MSDTTLTVHQGDRPTTVTVDPHPGNSVGVPWVSLTIGADGHWVRFHVLDPDAARELAEGLDDAAHALAAWVDGQTPVTS